MKSWEDGGPRFIVASVWGFEIKPAYWATGKSRDDQMVCWQVLDRAYAHRVVREWKPDNRAGYIRAQQEQEARAVCRELNVLEVAT